MLIVQGQPPGTACILSASQQGCSCLAVEHMLGAAIGVTSLHQRHEQPQVVDKVCRAHPTLLGLKLAFQSTTFALKQACVRSGTGRLLQAGMDMQFKTCKGLTCIDIVQPSLAH